MESLFGPDGQYKDLLYLWSDLLEYQEVQEEVKNSIQEDCVNLFLNGLPERDILRGIYSVYKEHPYALRIDFSAQTLPEHKDHKALCLPIPRIIPIEDKVIPSLVFDYEAFESVMCKEPESLAVLAGHMCRSYYYLLRSLGHNSYSNREIETFVDQAMGVSLVLQGENIGRYLFGNELTRLTEKQKKAFEYRFAMGRLHISYGRFKSGLRSSIGRFIDRISQAFPEPES